MNIARVEALTLAGRMAPSGLEEFRARDEARTGLYSFERQAMSLEPSYVKRFRAQKGAWEYFQAQPPGYRRTSIFWVMSAKRDETQQRRLATLIDCSARARECHSWLVTRFRAPLEARLDKTERIHDKHSESA